MAVGGPTARSESPAGTRVRTMVATRRTKGWRRTGWDDPTPSRHRSAHAPVGCCMIGGKDLSGNLGHRRASPIPPPGARSEDVVTAGADGYGADGPARDCRGTNSAGAVSPQAVGQSASRAPATQVSLTRKARGDHPIPPRPRCAVARVGVMWSGDPELSGIPGHAYTSKTGRCRVRLVGW